MFFLTIATTETIKHELKWGTNLPSWSIFLLVLVLLGWIYTCYKHEQGSSSWIGKSFLAGIRFVILVLLLAIFCEPILQTIYQKTRKSSVIFMVDTSMSMTIKDRYQDDEQRQKLQAMFEQSEEERDVTQMRRIDIANHILTNSPGLEKLKGECELRFFRFDNDISGIRIPKELDATGQKTNIYDNLLKTMDSFSSKRISAVFILTDGQHNSGKRSWQQAAKYSQQREEIPIFTVGIGSATKKRDIVVAGVEAPDIALVDDKVRFLVEIKHVGYEGTSIPIYLKWGETLLTEKVITLEREGKIQKVALFHTFRSAEDYQLTVLVPEQPGEFTAENNLRRHNIKIIQQKIKILYLEGKPRWEYRYLKNALIRDETVLANTWLFAADSAYPQEKSKGAPSLQGIPSREQLFAYHCLILGDVSPEHLNNDNMQLLVDFVKEKGGGIAFISGPHHNPGAYVDSPLSKLLPVIVDQMPNENIDSWEYSQKLRLSPQGKLHSIMRLVGNVEDNLNLWENEREGLPGFYWYFPVSEPKPGATVLALHRTTNKVLMATQFYGKGKTFFTALDSSWRWRFLYGDRYFYRFWGQVIRHISMAALVGSNRQYYLRVDNTQYTLGESVNILLRVNNPQQLQTNLPKEWEIEYKASGEQGSKTLFANKNEPGTYEGALIATRLGVYKLWFQDDQGKEVSVLFQVTAPMAETENTHLNKIDLQKLAKQTRGEYLPPYLLEDTLQNLNPEKESIPSYVREEPLWDRFWIFWLIVAFFTLEWVVRKLLRML